MRTLQILTITCCLGTATLVRAESLTVIVENVMASEGKIMLELLSSEEEFSGSREATASLILRANTGETSFSTTNLPTGDYAVRIMHDRNGNNELDSNFVGMPTEPWGFSNNAAGNFGPPTWQDAKFSLQGSAVQSIRLNH